MNQQKIGKFIATCRKEQDLTQEQLADKLGITKNAVSKWERGISFPDVSLFKSLCEELDINVEELINGEKDKSDKAKEKAILATINEKNRINKKSKKTIAILCIGFILILGALFYYNEKTKVNLVTDSDYLYDKALEYIRNDEIKTNPDSNKKDFNAFYTYYGFGIEEKGDYKYAYMWIVSYSYYIEKEGYLESSLANFNPCKVTFKDDEVVKVKYPKSGKFYESSVIEMFPKKIANEILLFDKEIDGKKINQSKINQLYDDIINRKNIYYDYLDLDMNTLTIDDLSYNDLIFSISYWDSSCVTPLLVIYKNNKYVLYTAYKSCKPGEMCDMMLEYTKKIEGTYDFDIMEIIRHSIDGNNKSFTTGNFPKYEINCGKAYKFYSYEDNKPLMDFLKSINADLKSCAQPDYGDD